MDAQLETQRLENHQQEIPGKNVELWQILDSLLSKHKIKWVWVKGHNGHPENERVDKLARDEAKSTP